jgi:uncharacterized protein (DUF924 family)
MPTHVLRFWFDELLPAQWWRVDPELDRQIHDRFGETHRAAHGAHRRARSIRS